MLYEGLYALLTNSPAITAILGTPATRPDHTTGIFPVLMPESARPPAVVYGKVAGSSVLTLDGGASDLASSRLQYSCHALDATTARNLAAAVSDTLNGIKMTLSEGTQLDVADVSEGPDAFEDAPFFYHSTLDVEFWYREPS